MTIRNSAAALTSSPPSPPSRSIGTPRRRSSMRACIEARCAVGGRVPYPAWDRASNRPKGDRAPVVVSHIMGCIQQLNGGSGIVKTMLRRTLVASVLLVVASFACAQAPRIAWQYQGMAGTWQPIDFSPTGATIVYGAYGSFRTLSVASGAVLTTYGNSQTYGMSGLTFSPDGSKIYAASFDATLQTWATRGN